MRLPRTVLLVAHGPALRTTVKLHLGKGGAFEFAEAGDAASARELLRTREVHLVIADLDDGELAALAEALQCGGRAGAAPPPVVAVGTPPPVAATARCAFVRRPVTWPRLRAAIESVLGGAV